jgi:hypothetical protein
LDLHEVSGITPRRQVPGTLRQEVRSLLYVASRPVEGAEDEESRGDLTKTPSDEEELVIEGFHVFFLVPSGSSVA